MGYPKPPDGKPLNGPDGAILRQGSAGRLGWNPNTETGEEMNSIDRRNVLECDEADFGGEYGGQDHDYDNPAVANNMDYL
jgi:hypothetical protein